MLNLKITGAYTGPPGDHRDMDVGCIANRESPDLVLEEVHRGSYERKGEVYVTLEETRPGYNCRLPQNRHEKVFLPGSEGTRYRVVSATDRGKEFLGITRRSGPSESYF